MISKLKILLVEDNPLNQKIVSFYLQKEKHEVKIVSSGERAIEVFLTDEFDLVLMDIMLPGIDGFETTQRFREIEDKNKERKNSIIIALTANTLDNDRERCRQNGMDDYLSKPFELQKLYYILKKFDIK
jgi:CheY-like chemotaxis protein